MIESLDGWEVVFDGGRIWLGHATEGAIGVRLEPVFEMRALPLMGSRNGGPATMIGVQLNGGPVLGITPCLPFIEVSAACTRVPVKRWGRDDYWKHIIEETQSEVQALKAGIVTSKMGA